MHTTTARSIELKAKLLRGVSDVSRLSILEVLRGGPRSVGEIVESTGLGQPNVSNHLACLRDCGLVVRERRGRHAFYGLSDPRVEGLLRGVEDLLGEVGEGVAVCPRYDAA